MKAEAERLIERVIERERERVGGRGDLYGS